MVTNLLTSRRNHLIRPAIRDQSLIPILPGVNNNIPLNRNNRHIINNKLTLLKSLRPLPILFFG